MIILVLLGAFLVYSVRSYDGTCPSFEPPSRSCSFIQFLLPAFFLVVLFILVTKPLLSFSILLLIFALPVIGFVLGRRAIKT
jgi:hypothetical protein